MNPIPPILAQAATNAPRPPALGDEVSSALRDLDWSAHTIVLGALVIGIAVWLFGRALSRLAFGGVGLVLGASAGWSLPAAVGLNFDTWLTTGIGAILGLIVGMAALRFVVASSLGVLLAAVSPFVMTGLLTLNPPPPPGADPDAPGPGIDLPSQLPTLPLNGAGGDGEAAPPAGLSPEELKEWKDLYEDFVKGGDAEGGDAPAGGGPGADDPGEPSQAEQTLAEGAERVRVFFGALGDQLRPYWDEMDGRQKTLYIGAALLALAVGVGGGMLLPKKSAALVTAFLGAGLWIPASVWLCSLAGKPLPGLLPESPLGWVAVWLGAGALGTVFQWTGIGGRVLRRGKKKRGRTDDE